MERDNDIIATWNMNEQNVKIYQAKKNLISLLWRFSKVQADDNFGVISIAFRIESEYFPGRNLFFKYLQNEFHVRCVESSRRHNSGKILERFESSSPTSWLEVSLRLTTTDGRDVDFLKSLSEFEFVIFPLILYLFNGLKWVEKFVKAAVLLT